MLINMAKKEEQRHKQAFRTYYSYRQSNTKTKAIKLAAEKLGIGNSTLRLWYKDFNWQEKEEEKNRKINTQLDKKQEDKIVNDAEYFLHIIRKSYTQMLKKGEVPSPENVRDIKILIEAYQLIKDSNTEQIDFDEEILTNDEFFNKELEFMKELIDE